MMQSNTGAMKQGNFIWPYAGGYLLHDKIIIKMTTTLNQNAAGAAFTANTVAARCNFEIDWAEVSMNDFKDYILENVYSDG
jgi:hypothetical protein